MLTPIVITLASFQTIPYTQAKCTDVAGIYFKEIRTIYLCEPHSQDPFYKEHETGHDVWFYTLTEEQRKAYTKAYERDQKKGIRWFYREYSMGSAEEDFADNYALRNSKVKIQLKRRVLLINKFLGT